MEAVYAAVVHGHQQEGVTTPTSYPAVHMIMRAVCCKYSHPCIKVKPLSEAILCDMLNYLDEAEHTVPNGYDLTIYAMHISVSK